MFHKNIFSFYRHSHWLKITDDYNKARGTKVTYQSLAKKLANMKQKDRQKIMTEKKKGTKDMGDDEKTGGAKVRSFIFSIL
jgi:hypothetical protein